MIAGIDLDNIVLLLISIMTAVNGILAFLARRDAAQTKLDVKAIEINTNSMKDALVASTAKASYSEGSEDSRKAGEAKADQLATQTALITAAKLTPVPEKAL